VLLTKGVNASLELVRSSLRRRDVAQIGKDRRGAIIAGGVAPLDFVVDLTPCKLATRDHGRKTLFARLRCFSLALRLRRRLGGQFAGGGDLGGAGAQFSDRSRLEGLDARALGDAFTNAPTQLGADKRIAIVKP